MVDGIGAVCLVGVGGIAGVLGVVIVIAGLCLVLVMVGVTLTSSSKVSITSSELGIKCSEDVRRGDGFLEHALHGLQHARIHELFPMRIRAPQRYQYPMLAKISFCCFR